MIRSQRGRASAIAGLVLLAGLAGAPQAPAQIWHWHTGAGVWSHGPNWFSGTAPAPGSDVYIGSMVAASNAQVRLDVSAQIANLTITDGMSLVTDSNSLRVAEQTRISGANPGGGSITRSTLAVDFIDGTAFRTGTLLLEDGGVLLLRNAFTRVDDAMTTQAGTRTTGNGHIWFAGAGSTLVNNGIIAPGTGEGLHLRQLADGRFNLDGAGDGSIWLNTFDVSTASAGRLTLQGAGLTDAFSGRVDMRRGSRLTMNLTEGWTADAASRFEIDASGFGGSPAEIEGAAFTFAGRMDVTGAGPVAIDSETFTVAPGAELNLPVGGSLEVGIGAPGSSAVIEGGTFNLAPTGNVNFHRPTTLRGGVFNGSTASWGTVDFFSGTAWDGQVTFTGVVRNFGNASVQGPTVINAATFRMGDADSNWSVAAPLVINAGSLTHGSVDGFVGRMSITGGFANNLTVNLPGADPSWRMGGRLTIGGVPAPIPITRVSGSRMRVEGELVVPSGIARVNADTVFSDLASIDIAGGATLRMQGLTVIENGAAFTGQGGLHNGVGASLRVEGWSSLQDVGLINSGELSIAPGAAGLASVGRFESTPEALWILDVRGQQPALGYDRLVVTGGPAELAGLIMVRLDPAPGGFRPAIGQEFTVLLAPQGVTGVFANVPASMVGGVEYGWEVIYQPDAVVLRLDRIVPSPGVLALVGLGGLMIAARRRQG